MPFHFVCFAWIFVRADSLQSALALLRQLSKVTVETSNLPIPVVFLVTLGFAAHWTPNRLSDIARDGFVGLPATAQACVLFALAVGLYFVASSDVVPFIYSRL